MKNLDAPQIVHVDLSGNHVLVNFADHPVTVSYPSSLLYAAKELAEIMSETEEPVAIT